MASESKLEKWCRKYAEERDCYLVKWVSPGNRGVPDRILLGRNRVVFIEFKTPEGRLSSQQRVWALRFQRLKLDYVMIQTTTEFATIMAAVMN
jgi:hypothetical protein